ncbi:MAG: hypothetical protein AAF394_02250 [Planctomycetota bacterium]
MIARSLLAVMLFAATWNVGYAKDDLSKLLADAESLELEHYKWTAANTISYWDVKFSGDEIRSVKKFLRNAKPYHKQTLFTSCVKGTFKTKDREFRIAIGDEKLSSQPVVIVLQNPKWPYSLSRQFRLTDDDAKAFRKQFEAALEAKIHDVKPDRQKKL